MLYVVVDRAAAEVLSRKVASPVVLIEDNVLVGPSSKDLERHRAMRAKYWGFSPSTHLEAQLASARLYSGVCVCLGPNLRDLLSLCRVCSFLPEASNCLYNIELTVDSLGESASLFDPPHAIVIDYAAGPPLRPAKAKVKTPWSYLQAMFAATIWNLWCDPSPEVFSRYCAGASESHNLFGGLGRYHAGFFPRLGIHANGLGLSRFDELVFQQLSRGRLTREWWTVAQLSAASPALEACLSHTGNTFLEARLHAWSYHTQDRIVERRRWPQSSPEATWDFRLTAKGEDLLERVPSFDAAPPVEIGGAVAYDRHRPWINNAGVVSRAKVEDLRVFACG